MKNLDLIFDLISYEGSPTNDPSDALKVKNRIQETEILSTSRQQLQIADAITDSPIGLPDASSDYLVILTDRNISIKLNGSLSDIPLVTRANGKKTIVFYCKGPITGLLVSNASGATANIDVVICNK